MRRLPLAVFLVAMATLVLELSLTRVFDVVLTPMLGYLVIACAILSFALAGAYRTVRPPAAGRDPRAPLAWTAAAFGVATLAVLPAFNLLPFDHDRLAAEPATQTALFACMYLVAALPFFLAGLFLVDVFAEHAERIRTLYCWDLVGASLGCFAVLPLVGHVGPGGLLFVASALAFVAVALLAPRKAAAALVVVATGVAAVPFARAPDYFEFREHKAKRWVLEAKSLGRRELVWWDPISKIEVIDLT
ncbi:MAG: hypothetical protein GY856_22860, partial [bacterium]|nr:hypothetical protein [bacterium]